MRLVPTISATMVSLVPIALVCLLANPAVAGSWSESGDAGDLVSSAQTTAGSGALDVISGNLSTATDVDLYCIRITNVQTFSASLVCTTFSDDDIWLFDQFGLGVSANDGCQFSATNVTGQFVSGTGIHYIAVSANDDEALSSGGFIWTAPTNPTETAPDGAGTGAPLSGWNGPPSGPAQAAYSIQLTGAEYCDGPVATQSMSWRRVRGLFR